MRWERPLAAPSCDGWTAPHAGPTARAGDDLIRGALGQTYVGVPSIRRKKVQRVVVPIAFVLVLAALVAQGYYFFTAMMG